MELSAEDNLRLNVLLAQELQAVRIDESKMIVYALTEKGEAKVQLNSNCKDEKYIKEIKALFSMLWDHLAVTRCFSNAGHVWVRQEMKVCSNCYC
jgi:hypothetical protein